MKNLILLFIACTFLTFTSCKNEEKKQKEEKIKIKIKETFRVSSKKTTVKWTAYKTTEKTPVSGTFKKIKLDSKEAKNPIEALNDLEFYIPISSIFSDNEERDGKLKTSFFGAMLDTELLSGSLSFDANKMCVASIKMNGVSRDLPLSYTTEGNNFTFKGVMNLDDWNASEAIEALNKVCFELHKGADGVSKTWNEVAIEINTNISKQ
ncbi:MAG: hypothetical protein ACI93P_000901 [bacterium]|jgi:hypothetical protein